jgi:hypothetical protein
LNNNNMSYPRCKVAQSVNPGHHIPSYITADGKSTLFDDKSYSWDLIKEEAYAFRILPSIKSISSHRGSTRGHNLEIRGTSFGVIKEDLTIMASGQPCKITSLTPEKILCVAY